LERPTKEYVVILEPAERNWAAYVPDLPGCIATAKTCAATLELIQEAMELHIQLMREQGLAVPEPTSEAGRVCVDL